MVDNVVDAAVDWSHKAEVGGMRNAEPPLEIAVASELGTSSA